MSISDTGRQKTDRKLRLTKRVHWLLSVAVFALFWLYFRYSHRTVRFNKSMRYDLYVVILYAFLFSWFNFVFDSYELGYSRIRHLVLSQCLAEFFTVVIIYVLVSLAWLKIVEPRLIPCVMVIQTLLNCVWSTLANTRYYRLVGVLHTVVIYRDREDMDSFANITGKPIGKTMSIDKYVQYDGTEISEIRREIDGYKGIFVVGVNGTLMNGLCKYCVENDVRGLFVPHIGDVILSGAKHIRSFSSPVLSVQRARKSVEYLFLKRAFDILVSAIGIILLSPLMLLTAIMIRAYDGGPAIYKQVRLTKDAKEFRIIKFRSMRVDAEEDGRARLSTGEKDDRITPIGRLIRACRLDELPQLFNILKGDMTIVGPRPERPEIAAQYEKELPEFAFRLQVKAGLTGYAQVYGKYNTPPGEKLKFDLMYINDMGIVTDLELMFDTVRILFKKESTEGVNGGQATAMKSEGGQEKENTVQLGR